MTPLGWNYAQDNSIISTLVTLFCALKEIPVIELTNCSFRKTCLQEAQPDLAFYINSLENQPSRGNSAVDLNQFRLLRWWWQSLLLLSVMIKGRNVCFMKIWGARVLDCWCQSSRNYRLCDRRWGSRRIETSQVLPGLTMGLVQTTLKRSCSEEMVQLLSGFWANLVRMVTLRPDHELASATASIAASSAIATCVQWVPPWQKTM